MRMATGNIQVTALEFGKPVEALQPQSASLATPELELLQMTASDDSVWIANSAPESFCVLLNSGEPITVPGTNPTNWAPSTTAISCTLNGPESGKFGEGNNMLMIWRPTGSTVMFAAQIQIQSIGTWTSPRVLFIASNSPTSMQIHIMSGGVMKIDSVLPNVLTSLG